MEYLENQKTVCNQSFTYFIEFSLRYFISAYIQHLKHLFNVMFSRLLNHNTSRLTRASVEVSSYAARTNPHNLERVSGEIVGETHGQWTDLRVGQANEATSVNCQDIVRKHTPDTAGC
jgi:hypothetical protein